MRDLVDSKFQCRVLCSFISILLSSNRRRCLCIKIFLNILNRNSSSDSGGSIGLDRHWFCSRLIFVNEVQVKCKEQEIERKEVHNFTESTFHTIGFFWFYKY